MYTTLSRAETQAYLLNGGEGDFLHGFGQTATVTQRLNRDSNTTVTQRLNRNRNVTVTQRLNCNSNETVTF